MDLSWKAFFEEFKDRGRDATPFLITLAALTCLLITAGALNESGVADFIAPGLPWAGMIAVAWVLAWVVVAIRRARKRRDERWERRELSRDEWRVARSKLKKDSNQKSL
jgi:hypothetical protein